MAAHHSDLAFGSWDEISGPGRVLFRRILAGEGMLTPVKDFTWRGDRWLADRDHVVPDHEVVREHPELFTPAYAKERSIAVLRFLERKRALREKESWRLSAQSGR